MQANELVSPKTFISYSWTTPEHEQWVVNLATRLMSNGVEVILDKWDLREGHDIHRFMESMVHKDDAVDKVLIICDRGYKEKADSRSGGVGIESQIITPQIYKDVHQEKFIPIIAERDDNGNHFIPHYIASRLFVDLSSFENFEENYETLLRSIFNKPMYKKPTLGNPPSFLIDEDAPKYFTTPIVNQMKISSEKFPHKMRYLWSEFEKNLFITLETFQINDVAPENLEEVIVEKIQLLIPLRNDFVNAMELLIMTDTIEGDILVEFFENIYRFTQPQASNGRFFEVQCDHFKFFITEIFLYTITILLYAKKYHLISEIINSDYYFDSRQKNDFSRLRFHLQSLEVISKKNKRISIHADLMNQFKHKKYGNLLLETDLILYYISKINPILDSTWSTWFPITYIYLQSEKPIRFLSKLKSRAYFNKVSSVFGIPSKEEFADKISKFKIDRGYQGSWHTIPHPSSMIEIEQLCVID